MQKLRSQCKSMAWRAVDAVLPPRCIVSGARVERQGMIAPEIWAGLDFIAAPFCACCGFPFEFQVDTGSLCGPCLEDRPPFDTARAALRYNDTSRDMILGFKHADKTHAVLAFTPWLRRAGAEMLGRADFLAPVPLHRWRLIGRRYNQAALIAYALGRETGISVLADALLRVRATPSQGHLGIKDRHKNVRKAFAVHPKHAETLKGKNIVLVDDVYTTGATVKECSAVLLKSGAAQVDVLTLARVVKTGFS